MEVNFLGLQLVVSAFLPSLVQAQGRVIVVSSVSIKVPAPFQPYIIGKSALEALAKSMRQELKLKGIDLITVRPGAINTPLLKWMDGYENPIEKSIFEQDMKRSYHDSLRYVGRITSPDRVAGIIYKALTTSRPRRAYNINHSLLMKIAGWMPVWLRERIILQRFK